MDNGAAFVIREGSNQPHLHSMVCICTVCIHYTQYILHTLYTERFKSTPSTLQGVCILYPIHETTVKKKKSRILCIKFIHCEKRKSQILLIIRIDWERDWVYAGCQGHTKISKLNTVPKFVSKSKTIYQNKPFLFHWLQFYEALIC